MNKLKFYDLRAKKSFETSDYKVITKFVKGKERKFAVATAPSGSKAYRII